MDPSTSAAALKAEIARLTGAIEQRKIAEANARTSAYSSRPRGNVYINPNYKPPSRSAPTARPVSRPPSPSSKPQMPLLKKSLSVESPFNHLGGR
ncbi:hypothetical protein QCA50_009129 [Cerrena zonata]|uniref:Uncharacterized protein n=1 Tax=Cerrena zonata TaxID=2478898 RepID=A0AAW0GFW7_9APHY